MNSLFGNTPVAEGLGPTAPYPFQSVLDTVNADWQARKRWWVDKYQLAGIEIENEDGKVYHMGGAYDTMPTRLVRPDGKVGFSHAKGRMHINKESKLRESHSIFDPVLAELIYRWFCPKQGHVLDPFAGECCKGIVASALGYGYTGIELRERQVQANRQKANDYNFQANWICGDSGKLASLLPKDSKYDLIFTSPPYYDLEQYTKHNKKDSSTFATYEQFMGWYAGVFEAAIKRLRNNRFLCVKVGEIRDPTGAFRNFVYDNIIVFQGLGLHYFNELVLLHPVGTGHLRARAQFNGSRKVVKLHQNVLVFFKSASPNVGKACRKVFGGIVV